MKMEEMKNELLMHNPDMCRKVSGMVHSQESKGIKNIWIIKEKLNEDEYLALANGKFCTAIFNPFTGLFYADDIYGLI